MKKEELEIIIKKYQHKSQQNMRYGDEKCAEFDRIAEQIRNNINDYLDDNYYESEEDVINNVREVFEEDNLYDAEDRENINLDDDDL